MSNFRKTLFRTYTESGLKLPRQSTAYTAYGIFILFFLLVFLPAGMSETKDAALETTAGRFFLYLVEEKGKDAFREFDMTDAMRSWVQGGQYKAAIKAALRPYGGIGELQKIEIVRHDVQSQSVELFYSGKTQSFKAKVTFTGNQIASIHCFPWVNERTYGGTPIQIKTPTGTIYGTLLEPEQTTKPVPVVLFLAGSGPTDRNGGASGQYRLLAEALQKSGIASVRFDKRGIGASAEAGGDESKLRFEHFVDDTVRWIDLLSQEKKYSKVIVLGHSEGSLIGMLACIQSKKAVGFISLGGSGRPIDEVLREQVGRQSQSLVNALIPILDDLKRGKTVEKIPVELLSLARPSVQPYMSSWMQYDPGTELKKLTIPVLIVQGTTDVQVSVADAEKLSAANSKAKKVMIKDMNHVGKKCTTMDLLLQQPYYSDPKFPLHEDLVSCMTEFISGIK
jgi:pimeloyl-ACP methyl ester carboxylesterase